MSYMTSMTSYFPYITHDNDGERCLSVASLQGASAPNLSLSKFFLVGQFSYKKHWQEGNFLSPAN